MRWLDIRPQVSANGGPATAGAGAGLGLGGLSISPEIGGSFGFGVATNVGGQGFGVGSSFEKLSSKCNVQSGGSDFFADNNLKRSGKKL